MILSSQLLIWIIVMKKQRGRLQTLNKKIMKKSVKERRERISSEKLLLKEIFMLYLDLRIKLMKLVTKTFGNRTKNSL